MQQNEQRRALLSADISIAEGVVRREFPGQGIALNLETGHYHGLNRVADAMFAALEQGGSIPRATDILTRQFEAPRERIESDLVDFCTELLERGLIQAGDPASGAAGVRSQA